MLARNRHGESLSQLKEFSLTDLRGSNPIVVMNPKFQSLCFALSWSSIKMQNVPLR